MKDDIIREPWEFKDSELEGKLLVDFIRPIGRPPKFATADELLEAFKGFARYCAINYYQKHELIKSGEMAGSILPVKTVSRAMTLTGFTLFLGMGERWYSEFRHARQDDPNFSRVFVMIESACREHQVNGALAGAYKENLVARLNNITDRVDVTTKDQSVKADVDLSNYTDEQLRQLVELQRIGRAGS